MILSVIGPISKSDTGKRYVQLLTCAGRPPPVHNFDFDTNFRLRLCASAVSPQLQGRDKSWNQPADISTCLTQSVCYRVMEIVKLLRQMRARQPVKQRLRVVLFWCR